MNIKKTFGMSSFLVTLFLLSSCSGVKLKSVTELPSGSFIVSATGMAKTSAGPQDFLNYQGAIHAKSKGCTRFSRDRKIPVTRSGFRAAFKCLKNGGFSVADIISVGPYPR